MTKPHAPGQVRPEGGNDATARTAVILGAGGHARELFSVLRSAAPEVHVRGFVAADEPDLEALSRLGCSFLGGDDALRSSDLVVVGIGHPVQRRNLVDRLRLEGRTLVVVHPSASIGPDVRVGSGVAVFPGAVVTTNVTLGDHVHVNTCASISHDCTVGAYAAISPGARLCGNVEVGVAVLIGAGATVLPGVRIGDGARIGAGATVTRDVAAGTTVAGVPARPPGAVPRRTDLGEGSDD